MTNTILHARAKNLLEKNGNPEELVLIQVGEQYTYQHSASGKLLADLIEEIVVAWDSPLQASAGLLELFATTEFDLEVETAPGIWSLPLTALLKWNRTGVAPDEFCGQPFLMEIRAAIDAEIKSLELGLVPGAYPPEDDLLHAIDSCTSLCNDPLVRMRLEMFFELAYRYGWRAKPEDRIIYLWELLEETIGLLTGDQVEELLSSKLIQGHLDQYLGREA